MSSFYGGKQGRTYNIIERFDTISLASLGSQKNYKGSYATSSTYEAHDIVTYNNQNNILNYYIFTEAIPTTTTAFPVEKSILLTGMVESFTQGGSYTKANYGQYVIIDTILNLGQKNNPENGLLYRRGFNYSQTIQPRPLEENFYTDIDLQNRLFNESDWTAAWSAYIRQPGAGAIYVGQIVGADGDVPELKIITWEEMNDSQHIGKVTGSVIPSTIWGNEQGGDTISVAYSNTYDDFQNNKGAQIAFKIPRIFQTMTLDHDPYKQANVSQNIATTANPFNYQWDFTIPAGKHGTDLINFEIKPGNEVEQYTLTQDETVQQDKIYYKTILNEETHQWEFSIVENPITDDIENYYELHFLENNNQNQFLTYKIKDYSDKPEGVVSEDLGLFPWKVINNITTIDSPRQVLNIAETSATDIQLGDLVFISGNKYLICIRTGVNNAINSINQENNYQVGSILPVNADETNVLWRVIEISTEAPPHGLDIDYTYGNNTEVKYPVYDYFYMDNTGKLFVKRIENGQQYYDYISTLDSIINMDINHNNGTITINYISGKTQTLPFKTLNTIKLQSDKTLSQQLLTEYKYNEETIEEEVSGTINTILALRMKGDLLLALYSDPSYREAAIDGKTENKDYFYLEWTDPSPVPEGQERLIYDGGQGTNHRPLLPWIKLSSTNNQYHVFTYLNDFSELLEGGIYANGLTDGREGWLIQVNYQQDNQPTKGLFAFDYNCIDIDNTTDPPTYTYNKKYSLPPGSTVENNSCWFEVMSIKDAVAANPKDHLLISEAIEENNEIVPILSDDQLKTNGIWFIVSGGHD